MTEIPVEAGSGGAMDQTEKSSPASLCLAQWVIQIYKQKAQAGTTKDQSQRMNRKKRGNHNDWRRVWLWRVSKTFPSHSRLRKSRVAKLHCAPSLTCFLYLHGYPLMNKMFAELGTEWLSHLWPAAPCRACRVIPVLPWTTCPAPNHPEAAPLGQWERFKTVFS